MICATYLLVKTKFEDAQEIQLFQCEEKNAASIYVNVLQAITRSQNPNLL